MGPKSAVSAAIPDGVSAAIADAVGAAIPDAVSAAPSLDSPADEVASAPVGTSAQAPEDCGPLTPATPTAALERRSAGVAAAVAAARGQGTREDWLRVVSESQALTNTVTALQDLALAEVARRESDWSEDGTLGETVHAPGRVTVDAADLAAPALGASHSQAQRRVEQAVRVAAARVPVDADGGASPEPSGLGGLHSAMLEGRLDGYRAWVIATELELAPADVAEAVVAALEPHLDDEGPLLRRRCRRLLARISPELLRQRALRARAGTGLRRWVAEPGVDAWYGTFPSEDAALAWAAVDRLAHELVAAGTCSSVEQARGRALTDLVTGNATVDVQVVLTVPAGDCDGGSTIRTATSAEEWGAGGLRPPEAISARGATDAPAHEPPEPGTDPAVTQACRGVGRPSVAGNQADGHPAADRDADPRVEPVTDPAHDLRPQPPGNLSPQQPPGNLRPQPSGNPPPQPAGDPPGRGQRDALVQVQGARPSEPLLVRRSWLLSQLAETTAHTDAPTTLASSAFAPCDPLTGARLDPDDRLATPAYRPCAELAALVRARDGRCRFPGCAVAARFCDLDHVRPWPVGRTSAGSLLTLCRRHHRIKQRPGWRVHLARDGTATWTDPVGRLRTTAPLDALDSLVLPAGRVSHPPADRGSADPAPAESAGRPPAELLPPVRSPVGGTPDGPASTWSALETREEFRLEQGLARRLAHEVVFPPGHRRCTSSAALRAGFARGRARARAPDTPPF